MAGRNQTRRTLRELHGGDTEIIEMDAEGAVTGRTYRVVEKDEWAWAPTWLRLMIGFGGMVVLIPILVAQIAAVVFFSWILWLIGASIFRSFFS